MSSVPQSLPSRLSDAQARELYRSASLHELGRLAHEACLRRHPEPYRTYVVDRNINYSNLCAAQCAFCAFKAPRGSPAGWTLTTEQILGEIQELTDIGGTQVLLQGGLHPELPLQWYEQLLRDVKRAFPRIHMHGFSPPEIHFFARQFHLSVAEVLARLQQAGLDSVPGGGAEILADRVRKAVSLGKCLSDEWLEVMRQAHRLGMRTTATMMFGHIETDAERLEHLRRLRELQDESLSAGRGSFTAFISWTFQPDHTPLGQRGEYPPGDGDGEIGRWHEAFDGQSVRLAGAHEYLRTLALARLYLDNFANLQASWVTQGPKVGQLALFFGANDLGSVMMEEKVVSAAGTTYKLTEGQIRHLITDAGWQPRKRNCYYELLD